MKNTLLAIQGLRAIAASCVVVAHFILNLFEKKVQLGQAYLDFSVIVGGVGVNIFFAISGFIMVYNSFNSFGSRDAALDFFVRRILRIVPLYFIATTLQFVNKFHTAPTYDFKHFLYSILFIPYIGAEDAYRPVLGVGWTLNLEMFFYLIFTLSLMFPRKIGLMLSMSILGCLAVADASGLTLFLGLDSFYAQKILFYFDAGIVVGIIYKTYKPTPIIGELLALGLSVLLLMVAIISIMSTSATLSLVIGILAAGLSVYLCATAVEGKVNYITRVLNNLGNASYSVYLFHGFLLGAIKHFKISHMITGIASLVIYTTIVVIAANAIGFLSYRYLEIPITKILKGWYAKFRTSSRIRSYGSEHLN